MTTVTYTDPRLVDDIRLSPVPRRGILQLAPGQGKDCYGRKISSDYKIKYEGRWHRVYIACFSNVSSVYIQQYKTDLYLDIDTEQKLRELR